MARTKGKTEHAGAKNGGGGMWGKRAEVKSDSNKRRRAQEPPAVEEQLAEMDAAATEDHEFLGDVLGPEPDRDVFDQVARMSGNDTVARMS